MRRLLLALPLLVVVSVAGCDSNDEDDDQIVLDADYYVGTWSLVSVTEDDTDRTDELLSLLDGLDVTFEADRGFTLDADFNDVVNGLGQDDVELEGTYQAQAASRTLVLLVDGLAPSFSAEAEGQNRVDLTAPAALVTQLLDLPIELEGDVTLGVRRQ